MKYYYSLTILITLFIASCSGNTREEEQETGVETVLPEIANQVTIYPLQTGSFHHELISNGKLTSRRYADLYFESAEPVEQIFVKNGDRVTKGQPVAKLATFKLTNSLATAKTSLALAKLELQDLLIGQGYALEDSLKVPAATLDLVKIKSGYDNALAQYELAAHNEKNAVLRAPFDGVVANLFSKEHNIAPTGEAFCTIIDSRNIEVTFTVLENELSLVRIGDQVEISPFSMPDIKTHGRITEVNPVVDENGMVQLRASVSNSGKLFEGMNVRVSVQRSLPGQLVIPKTALVMRSGKQVVFTVTPDNKAYWNYVQTGLENATEFTITEGLKDGDIVIATGNINLAHESPVEIIDN
ncbi:MAG: efflux RND transporter periplasmic adaptor subunit [Tannerellaceae bacterium]|nr:efflux RND transporter periplasmic adaptor subunit [Tannerellaceae bacterium]